MWTTFTGALQRYMHSIRSLKQSKMGNENDDKTISSDEESCNTRFLERINPVASLKI